MLGAPSFAYFSSVAIVSLIPYIFILAYVDAIPFITDPKIFVSMEPEGIPPDFWPVNSCLFFGLKEINGVKMKFETIDHMISTCVVDITQLFNKSIELTTINSGGTVRSYDE